MSQHDMNLANAAGAAFRTDVNAALAALAMNSSGATEPSTTYAYQFWADTTTGLLKIRNAANSAWVTVGTLASAYLGNAQLAVANTWTADQTLGENVGIVLDAALSADGKYCGIVEAGTAGAALAFGELCYRQTSDSRWEKAQFAAAQIATACLELGMCVLAAAGDGSATAMLRYGKIRADSLFPTMTIGAAVYGSAATAGAITSTAPTGTTDFTVRKVGFASTADELFFNPSPDYITLV